MKRARLGDTISWTYPEIKGHPESGRKQIGKVYLVDEEEEHYGVYASYGQDLIGFNYATIEPLVSKREATTKSIGLYFAILLGLYIVDAFIEWDLTPFAFKSMFTTLIGRANLLLFSIAYFMTAYPNYKNPD